MFGWREKFTYLECAFCGCLQIVKVPSDLEKYYGESYYSVAPTNMKRSLFYSLMKSTRTQAFLEGKGFFGGLLLDKFGPPGLPTWVKHAAVRQDHSILEVGCGSGALLVSLKSEGFKNLTGLDPFIKSEINYGQGLKIHKARICEHRGEYDFIILEHAFEHIPDPYSTLRDLSGLLSPKGTLIISIPLAGYAWSHYGVDWVQLDAPRHLYLHTEKSFRMVAKNLTVFDVVFDSGAVQFWGSEQYAKDIPLLDERSYRVDPDASIFSLEAISDFHRKAVELNEKRLGDQATFYLRK